MREDRVSVRCRVCHDELVKACAEIAQLRKQLTEARREMRKARRKFQTALKERNEARGIAAKNSET